MPSKFPPPKKKTIWKHKKFGRIKFDGDYVKRKGQRVLRLENHEMSIYYKSWQHAVKNGWKRS